MSSASLMVEPKLQFFGNDGKPLSGGKLYTYQAGTMIPKDTYQSSTMQSINTNPIILDSAGRARVWLDTTVSYYHMRLTDSNDVEIWTEDNISGVGGSGVVTSPALPWIDAKDFNSLSAVVTYIGSSRATLVISESLITDSVTIPDNVDLRILKTAIVTVNPAQTLTINSSFEAGLYQCFSGTGAVVFGKIRYYEPAWFNNTTQPPAANGFPVGCITKNISPSVGQPKGWVCTVAGSPGTWVSEGNL